MKDSRTATLSELLAPNQIERFWSRVDKSGDCWLWTGTPTVQGYGQVGFNRKTYRAHRVAYELVYGPIAPGMFLCHRCDTRLCVNPSHIFVGTHEENNADAKRKRRMGPGEKRRRGEQSHMAKLNDEMVVEIRRRYAEGGITQIMLAREYGVDNVTIHRVIHRQSWTHVREGKAA